MHKSTTPSMQTVPTPTEASSVSALDLTLVQVDWVNHVSVSSIPVLLENISALKIENGEH